MGSKRKLDMPVLSNGAMTGTSTITSDVIEISDFDNVGLQLEWTGTPTGTITIQASNDRVNFRDLTFGTALTQPAGAASGILINFNQIPFNQLRVRYVNTSGSGTLLIFVTGRDLN